MEPRLENWLRRVVRARMSRGRQVAIAQAAGHKDGSWVSNWLAGKQKHASIDELDAMLKAVGLSLPHILPRQADTFDWEAFDLVGRLSGKPEVRADAIDLLTGLLGEGVLVVRAPSVRATRSPHRVARKGRDRR